MSYILGLCFSEHEVFNNLDLLPRPREFFCRAMSRHTSSTSAGSVVAEHCKNSPFTMEFSRHTCRAPLDLCPSNTTTLKSTRFHASPEAATESFCKRIGLVPWHDQGNLRKEHLKISANLFCKTQWVPP